jgi:hypothetical protein
MKDEKLRLGLSVILSRIKPNILTLKYTDRSTRSFIGRHVAYSYFVNYSALKFKVMRSILHKRKINFSILVTEVLWIVADHTYGHISGGERPWKGLQDYFASPCSVSFCAISFLQFS